MKLYSEVPVTSGIHQLESYTEPNNNSYYELNNSIISTHSFKISSGILSFTTKDFS